ncbi:hypothetical protein [Candidatus Protochlamydia phocaeensis]|uniref:hypothetical protein n=1 Tax=Candidatus Protochlamydia phocaeensis TaxID=1414722 RepID=UPI0008381E4A|nr:hypothetical protein [Candidatus Protochlamydia phocaeensis]
MFDYQLFLGFPLTSSYQKALTELDASQLALFIEGGDPAYLQKIAYQDQIYLGKYAGQLVELSSLESLQAHIYSLLRRLVPAFDYAGCPLVLLAVPQRIS